MMTDDDLESKAAAVVETASILAGTEPFPVVDAAEQAENVSHLELPLEGHDVEALPLDHFPVAYVLKWGPNKPCDRTALDLDAAEGGGLESGSGAAGSKNSESKHVAALRRSWGCEAGTPLAASSPGSAEDPFPASQYYSTPSWKLYIIRDTGNEDANRIICSALGVDPAFLAAHIACERYHPKERPWRGQGFGATFTATSFIYPQVLTLLVSRERIDAPIESPRADVRKDDRGNYSPKAPRSVRSARSARSARSDISAPQSNSPNSDNDKVIDSPVVMFCRAGFWASPRATVLVLDRNPSSTTLEDVLLDALDDTPMPDSESVTNIGWQDGGSNAADTLGNSIVSLAYDQWVDFFDTLGSSDRQANNGCGNKKLYWDMAQCLEQNLTAARIQDKRLHYRQQHQQNKSSMPHASEELHYLNAGDWGALLSRLERTVALLPLRKRKPSSVAAREKYARFSIPQATSVANPVAVGDIGGLTTRNADAMGPPRGVSESISPASGDIIAKPPPPYGSTPEGKEALNRVTYMGGVLLPFSIVAGILSMPDPVGPGYSLFWVFWAITLPLTFFILLIIYADDIRRAYVWKPMSVTNLQDAIRKGEAIPAAAAAALASAAETVIDKLASEFDSEVETEPVAAAVRPVDARVGRGERRRSRVRVTTSSGPDGPTYYRLSEPPEPIIEGTPVPAIPIIRMWTGGANADAENEAVPVGPRYRPIRRFHPLDAFRGHGPPVGPSQAHVGPELPVVEPAAGYDEAVVIDMNRPNAESGILADVLGPSVAAANIGAPGCPAIIVQQPPDGSEPTAWRRQQLGWTGAIKSIVGYQKPHKA